MLASSIAGAFAPARTPVSVRKRWLPCLHPPGRENMWIEAGQADCGTPRQVIYGIDAVCGRTSGVAARKDHHADYPRRLPPFRRDDSGHAAPARRRHRQGGGGRRRRPPRRGRPRTPGSRSSCRPIPRLVVAAEIAPGTDLIVTAHSHARISQRGPCGRKTRRHRLSPLAAATAPRHRGDRMDDPRGRSDRRRHRLPSRRSHGCRRHRRAGVVFRQEGRDRPGTVGTRAGAARPKAARRGDRLRQNPPRLPAKPQDEQFATKAPSLSTLGAGIQRRFLLHGSADIVPGVEPTHLLCV